MLQVIFGFIQGRLGILDAGQGCCREALLLIEGLQLLLLDPLLFSKGCLSRSDGCLSKRDGILCGLDLGGSIGDGLFEGSDLSVNGALLSDQICSVCFCRSQRCFGLSDGISITQSLSYL